MTGVMIVFTSLMNASPSGSSEAPKARASHPTSTPSAMATSMPK
jgi:hypothetical protein